MSIVQRRRAGDRETRPGLPTTGPLHNHGASVLQWRDHSRTPDNPMQKASLADEWSLLQNQCDSYEKHSLLIKLVAIAWFGAALLYDLSGIYPILLLATIWLQDAIWKTFQSRIERRLLQLEAALVDGEGSGQSIGVAYRFNSEFIMTRRQGSALVGEYLRQALRPTVAYPHAVLVVMLGLKHLF